MSVDRCILCEVFVPETGDFGTGTLIAPDLVLTALHVLKPDPEAGGEILVRVGVEKNATPEWRNCRRVHAAKECDLALLAPVDGGIFRPPGSFQLLRFGRRPERDLPCSLVGFPTATDNPERRFNDVLDVGSTVHPRAYERESRLGVDISGAVPVERNLWKGFSGAAVVCADTLIGVVLETVPEFGPRMLKAVPIECVLAKADWVGLVENSRGITIEAHIDDASDIPNSSQYNRPLESELRKRLESRLTLCIDHQLPFRTFHKLKALFEMNDGYVDECFDVLGSGWAQRVNNWLDKTIREHPRNEPKKFAAQTPLEDDPSVKAARIIASREAAAEVDERHFLLALMSDDTTATISVLKESLGEKRFNAVQMHVRETFPQTYSLGRSQSIASFASESNE